MNEDNLLLFGGAALIGWLVLVILYLAWAIHRYSVNFGMTNHEWKVFHPALYAREKELPRYQRLHEDWAKEQEQQHMGRVERAAFVPDENPYARESCGLPPGTMRGILVGWRWSPYLLRPKRHRSARSSRMG